MENDFRAAATEFSTINLEIKRHREAIQTLTKRKKLLSTFVKEYMVRNKKQVCNMGPRGQIVLKVSKRKVPLNKGELTRILSEYFHQDKAKAEEVTEYIYNNRMTKETSNITHKEGEQA